MCVENTGGIEMSEFKSALAPYMKGLIAQKRALGFKYYEQESQLLLRILWMWQLFQILKMIMR